MATECLAVQTSLHPTRRFLAPPPAEPLAPGPTPTFSVVIAAYQAADFVADAVGSALRQSYPAREVIVCDDGSSDDLDRALAPFRDSIVLLRQSNRGAGAARNAGTRAASGDFVAFLDADDVFLGERLQALAELAALRPDLDVLATDAYFEEAGRVVGRFGRENPFPVSQQRRGVLERCFVVLPAFRRSRLLEMGGFDEAREIAPAEDWELLIRLVLDGSRVGLVDEPLLRYRLHPHSATSQRQRSLWSRVAVLEKARTNPAAGPEERTAIERSLRRNRERAMLADIRALAALGGRGRRRELLSRALAPSASPRARLAALGRALSAGRKPAE